ncbi:MAG: hypothetical protein ACLTVK_09315, partial [Christensenellaceae bacterium]
IFHKKHPKSVQLLGCSTHAVLFIDGRLMVSPRHDDLRSGFQNRRDVLCHFFHDFNADFILLRRSFTLPKHSEQRCGYQPVAETAP